MASVLEHEGVELVVNLTIPAAHAEVASQAIAAGKHVWNEKPLALDRPSGQALLDASEAAGLRIGCAPDTFLGAGLQAARRVIERGDIGVPLTALILMQSPGRIPGTPIRASCSLRAPGRCSTSAPTT